MAWTNERARVAALTRSRGPDDDELLDARRALKEARLEDQIRSAVADWPQLTSAQCDRLAVLLRGGGQVA